MSRSTGSCAQASMTYCVPFFSRFDGAWTTIGRSRSLGGTGVNGAQVEPGRDHLRVRHPAERVERADDLRVGAPAVRELLRRLAADVGAEVVEDGLLAGRAQDRELQRLRHEREPEVEVEDVGAREQARERAPLRELLAREAAAPVERPVRLRVPQLAVEDDEPRVDVLAPQREHVLPRDPGEVDRAVRDRSAVPLELVEVAQRRAAGADPGGVGARALRRRSRRARASRRGTGCSGPPGRRSSRSAG